MESKVESNKFYGGLWLNQKKTSVKSPILTGNIAINGKKFNVGIWKQEDREGNKPHYKICLSEGDNPQQEDIEELN